MRTVANIMIVGLAVLLALSAFGAEEAPVPHYRLKVMADPAAHKLDVEAWVTSAPSGTFYLYKTFKVTSVEADGKPVAFKADPSLAPLPYSRPSLATVADAEGAKELHIRYSGEMSEMVSGINTVKADLVELACYTSWFPGFSNTWRYDYELELNLPEGFVATTNGDMTSQRVEKGRVISSWKSITPGFDIPVVASPKLKKVEREMGGTRVEMFASSAIPEPVLREQAEGVVEEMRLMAARYGPPSIKGMVRIVYSPRDGWDYSRVPMFVASEGRVRDELMGEAGEARVFHDNAHELAHFWWGFTGNDSLDNWIDEGLAEYSAFRMTSDRYGIGYNVFQIGQYQRRIKTVKLTYAIAETPENTIDREINRYDRAALMFLEAEQRFGRSKLDEALRAVRTQFTSGTPASTAVFLDVIEKEIGKEAAAFFREELYRKPTNEPALKPAS